MGIKHTKSKDECTAIIDYLNDDENDAQEDEEEEENEDDTDI